MSQTAIEKAEGIQAGCEVELEDLKLYLESSKAAYYTSVGKKYEPLQKRTVPNKTHRSAAQRLADAQAEQKKVDAAVKKYGK